MIGLKFGAAKPPVELAAPSQTPRIQIAATPTHEYAPFAGLESANFSRNLPATFEVDFKGLNGTGGGFIFELGGASFGAYAGFSSDGKFIWRVGGSTLGAGNAAHISAASGTVHGDGKLILCVNVGTPLTVKAYWNDVEVGTRHDGSAGSAWWAGADNGGFLKLSGSLASGGIGDRAVSYQTISTLRYYSNYTI